MSFPPGASDAVRVGGGDINEAWRVRMPDGGTAFVKSRRDVEPGEYRREAASLRWLAEPGTLQVPNVVALGGDYLALEWIEQGSLDAAGAEELGRGLALMHAAGAPRFGEWESSARSEESHATVGSLSLPNDPLADWPSFYAQRRLIPALRAARASGAVSQGGERAVVKVCERIDSLAGPAEPPARLHGDLWSGNVLAGRDGRPWLIDPTAYGGHREVDLAMLQLFGAPPARVLAAYEEAVPLAEGWRERVGLWQLLPLLVHAALFGGAYGAQAERVAVRYAG